jgi:hypothetical protein
MIDPDDLKLIRTVDTPEEAMEYLKECHRFGFGRMGTVIGDI